MSLLEFVLSQLTLEDEALAGMAAQMPSLRTAANMHRQVNRDPARSMKRPQPRASRHSRGRP